MGIAAQKRRIAKHKFPWTKFGGESNSYQPRLEWKRGGFAEVR